jgi:hypothetical protein
MVILRSFAVRHPRAFADHAQRFRNPDVWSRRDDGTWVIERFLIPDFDWQRA